MTSKCGKNKKVVQEAIVECATGFLAIFWRTLCSFPEQMDAPQHGTFFVLYNSMLNVCYEDVCSNT